MNLFCIVKPSTLFAIRMEKVNTLESCSIKTERNQHNVSYTKQEKGKKEVEKKRLHEWSPITYGI